MVVLGRVSAPHGVKGWIKVQPFTQEIEGLLDYPMWWLGKNGTWQQLQVAEVAVHGATVLARLEGCADREAAAGLKGKEVAVPRSELPAPGEGEFYWSDLIGAAVVNRQGEQLGRVVQLLDTGANSVMVVEGERERLVPFIAGVILQVDIAASRVTVDWERDF